MILDHQIDIGLVEGIVHSQEIRVERLFYDELYLICSHNHRWAKANRQSVTVEELAREPLIQRERGSGTREVVENELRQHQVAYQTHHVLNNTEAIKKAVEADIGIAFVSKLAVQEEIRSGRLVRLEVEGVTITRELLVIFHKDKYRSSLFGSFLKHLEIYRPHE